MKNFMWWARLCGIFFRMGFQSTVSYFRWSFISVYISHVVGYLGSYIVIWTGMRMFDGVNGWGVYEVMFLYSVDLLSYSFSQVFLQPFWDMDDLVVSGGLDQYLLRPINPLFHLLARHIAFGYIAHISLGIGVVFFVLSKLGIVWGILQWVQFLITIVGATMIQAGISIIPSCAAFWLNRADQLSSLMRWDLREYIRYPVSIYPKLLRSFLTVVVPFAFVNYYPSLSLIKSDGLTALIHLASWATPLIGLILIIISYRVWLAGLRRYNSSGT